MKHIILTTTLCALTATQAMALSCVKPDVANAFKGAMASDLNYVVLKGTFAFTPPAKTQKPQAETIEAEFSGRLLTDQGFTQQVAAPLTINLTCAGEWCADMSPNTSYVTFVENRDSKLVLDVSPCYALTFKELPIEEIKRLENCAQGGACEGLAETR